MSNSVIFSEQEQLAVRELQANLDLFNGLKALLTHGQFPGNAATALVRCQQFTDTLIASTQEQINLINKTASERATKA